MKAYFRRTDPLLIGPKPRPTGRAASSEAIYTWTLKNAIAKGNIILCLDDSVAPQRRIFVDDDGKTTR